MLPRLSGWGWHWGEERLLAFGIIFATGTHGASPMNGTVGAGRQFMILPQEAHITHHSSRKHDTEGEEGAVGGAEACPRGGM